MPRSIDLTVISGDYTNKAFLRKHFEHVNGCNVKKQAGIFNREFKFKYSELNSIHNVYKFPDAVLFEVSPKKGESEKAFIERIRQECSDLAKYLKYLHENEDNLRKKLNIQAIHLILVLNKTNLLSEEVVGRLQLHLKQMIVRYGVVFTISTTQSSSKEMEAIFLKAGQLAMRAKRYSVEPEKNIALKALGAITGFLIETLSDIIRCNPIAEFFLVIRSVYRTSSNIFSFLCIAALTLLIPPIFLVDYCFMPLFAIYNTYKGWRNGPAEVINDSYNRISDKDVVAGTLILVLMISAAFCVIFPPASLVTILPTLIASVSLTGFSSAWLAIFASLAVFVVTASLYAMGSNLFDYVTTSHDRLPALSEEPIQFIPASSAAAQMAAAPSATPTQQTFDEMGPVLSARATVFSTAAATSDVEKPDKALDDASQPLLVPKGPY